MDELLCFCHIPMRNARYLLYDTFKCHYDENRIFSIKAILKHKQIACMRRKMLFTIFKYLVLFQRYSSFKNMQISQVITSYPQPNFDRIR